MHRPIGVYLPSSLRLTLRSGSLSASDLPSWNLFLLSGSSHWERYGVISTVSGAI